MRSVDSVAACVFGALDSLWWRLLLKKMTISRLEFLANFFGGICVGIIFACFVSVQLVGFRERSLQSSRRDAEAPKREAPGVDRSGWRERERKDATDNDSMPSGYKRTAGP